MMAIRASGVMAVAQMGLEGEGGGGTKSGEGGYSETCEGVASRMGAACALVAA